MIKEARKVLTLYDPGERKTQYFKILSKNFDFVPYCTCYKKNKKQTGGSPTPPSGKKKGINFTTQMRQNS